MLCDDFCENHVFFVTARTTPLPIWLLNQGLSFRRACCGCRNPAVEQQAQDRIHRLGQFRPIRVTRFVIKGSIEERILKLQEKKQLVFEGWAHSNNLDLKPPSNATTQWATVFDSGRPA